MIMVVTYVPVGIYNTQLDSYRYMYTKYRYMYFDTKYQNSKYIVAYKK